MVWYLKSAEESPQTTKNINISRNENLRIRGRYMLNRIDDNDNNKKTGNSWRKTPKKFLCLFTFLTHANKLISKEEEEEKFILLIPTSQWVYWFDKLRLKFRQKLVRYSNRVFESLKELIKNRVLSSQRLWIWYFYCLILCTVVVWA